MNIADQTLNVYEPTHTMAYSKIGTQRNMCGIRRGKALATSLWFSIAPALCWNAEPPSLAIFGAIHSYL